MSQFSEANLARIAALKGREAEYRHNPDLVGSIGDRTLIMIVAPAAMGKSTLVATLESRYPDTGHAINYTTRHNRPDDTPSLRHVNDDASLDKMLTAIENGLAANYAVHPTTGDLYGTMADSFKFEYNILETLSGVVAQLGRAPFGSTYTFSLTAEPEAWAEWFNMRYPEIDDEAIKRLGEARQSIQWSLAQTNDHHWLINLRGQQDLVADTLMSIVRGGSTPSAEYTQKAQAYAQAILEKISKLESSWSTIT